MIQKINDTQYEYFFNKDEISKKSLAQYFTNTKTAKYMAQMIKPIFNVSTKIKILDAGAGILSIALASYLFKQGYKNISSTLYEIDNDILNMLNLNMG